MDIKRLSDSLGIKYLSSKDKMQTYESIRSYYFDRFKKNYENIFQSPSINPTSVVQRGYLQNEKEHSAYQRADFTPISVEQDINKLFKKIEPFNPHTLVFNSGMAAISSLIFYFKNTLKLESVYIGENVYFETKWIFDNYEEKNYVNEYDLSMPNNWDILWVEYPINCTQPKKYPLNKQLNIKKIMNDLIDLCEKSPKKQHYLVVDYTLYFMPFSINNFISYVPKNLHIYLVTSLQKHRGYGLDLNNGGAITIYNIDKASYDNFLKLRAILGTSFTQESLWIMPKINNKLINQTILDSGKNAKNIFSKIYSSSNNIKVYFSDNENFLTSFIFLVIDKKLIRERTKKPFLSDLLIKKIIESANKNSAIIVHGTSFGLPYCRIFKNSERHENTDSLRIAVGYDEEMIKNVPGAINEGIKNFLKSL